MSSKETESKKEQPLKHSRSSSLHALLDSLKHKQSEEGKTEPSGDPPECSESDTQSEMSQTGQANTGSTTKAEVNSAGPEDAVGEESLRKGKSKGRSNSEGGPAESDIVYLSGEMVERRNKEFTDESASSEEEECAYSVKVNEDGTKEIEEVVGRGAVPRPETLPKFASGLVFAKNGLIASLIKQQRNNLDIWKGSRAIQTILTPFDSEKRKQQEEEEKPEEDKSEEKSDEQSESEDKGEVKEKTEGDEEEKKEVEEAEEVAGGSESDDEKTEGAEDEVIEREDVYAELNKSIEMPTLVENTVNTLEWSHCGNMLACATSDGLVLVWRRAEPDKMEIFEPKPYRVYSTYPDITEHISWSKVCYLHYVFY